MSINAALQPKNETNLNKTDDFPLSKEDNRNNILALEQILAKVPGATFGDSSAMPLKHSFSEGIYVREIFIPKGFILTGKIHRHSHPNFLMKGEVVVITEEGGREHLKAPLSMISEPGTKRAVLALEDTTWVTVHLNVDNKQDLEKIEDYVIAKSYDDPELLNYQLKKRNCLILSLKEKGLDCQELLELKHNGTLLPFKESLVKLKEKSIPLDGLFASRQDNGEWHVTTTEGMPLSELEISDADMVGSWAAVAAGGATLVGSYFGSKGKKTSQVPLETVEQRQARQKLMGFANTGKFGEFKAGEEQNLGYGDYNATGMETQGLSTLQGLLNGGIPQQFQMGDEALRDYLQTDPSAIQAQFDPFKAQVERQIGESNTALKRNAGFAGNLYSTDTIRNLGDIQARGNETLTAQLANLTNESLNRRLQAIPLAYQSGEAQQNAALQQVGASQTYGSLTRQLNDASIKMRDAELLRRRQELQLPIQAAQTVAGQSANFGVPSVNSNPYGDLLGMVGQIGGNYLNNEMSMKQYQRNFPSGAGSNPTGYVSPYSKLSLGGGY